MPAVAPSSQSVSKNSTASQSGGLECTLGANHSWNLPDIGQISIHGAVNFLKLGSGRADMDSVAKQNSTPLPTGDSAQGSFFATIGPVVAKAVVYMRPSQFAGLKLYGGAKAAFGE